MFTIAFTGTWFYPTTENLGMYRCQFNRQLCAHTPLGLLEYIFWCEDMHMIPILGVYAGLSFGDPIITGDALRPYVEDALSELEVRFRQ